MEAEFKTIAIIPARRDSKGIPKKNIVDLAGRPLIAWSIEQAKNSKLVDIVFVSTDDNEIAGISRNHGAKIIKRPAELATGTSSSEDALLHAIDFIKNVEKIKIDIIVFLQATSPVRDQDDIDRALRQYMSEKADSLFSCSKIEDFFIWEKKKGNYLSMTYDYHNRKMRQDIGPRYLENGSIYIFKPELIEKKHNRLGGKITNYVMPFWKSFQIDHREDLEICDYYIRTRILKEGNKNAKRYPKTNI